jgi:hypothetical protein
MRRSVIGSSGRARAHTMTRTIRGVDTSRFLPGAMISFVTVTACG